MDNIFCIECGFELPSTVKFCKKCGVQIDSVGREAVSSIDDILSGAKQN